MAGSMQGWTEASLDRQFGWKSQKCSQGSVYNYLHPSSRKHEKILGIHFDLFKGCFLSKRYVKNIPALVGGPVSHAIRR